MRGWLAVVALVFPACCTSGMDTIPVRRRVPLPESYGVPEDNAAEPGSYDGYEVFSDRGRVWIVGNGRHQVAPLPDGWLDEHIELRDRLERRFAGPVVQVMFETSGPSRDSPDQQETQIVVYVGSYAQIGAAVRLVGDYEREEDRHDVVVVRVYRPRSEAHPNEAWLPAETRLVHPPFTPYEASLALGPRVADADIAASLGLHLGWVWGRARARTVDGWFAGLGADATGLARWAVGPSARVGWAFGVEQVTWPTDRTYRGTYAFLQTGALWGEGGTTGTIALGFNTDAPLDKVVKMYGRRRRLAWWLFPFVLVNHVEVSVDTEGATSVLFGFGI
jgi:hypothetical protein